MIDIKKTFRLGLLLTVLFGAKATKYYNENDIPELIYLDTSVDPCDDFYEFTCGNFPKINPRPTNLNIVDQFTLLQDELIEIGKEILSGPKNSNDPIALKKSKAAFRACTNIHSFNNNISPEILTVQQTGGMPLLSAPNQTTQFSWNEIGDLVGQYGVPLIFAYAVSQISQKESVIRMSADPLLNPVLFRPRHQKSYDEVLEESFQELGRTRDERAAKPAAFNVFLDTLAKKLLLQTNSSKTDEEIEIELNDMANFMRQMYAGGIVDGDILPLDTETTVGKLQEWTENQFGEDIDINWIDYLNHIFQPAGVTITKDVKFYHQNLKYIYGALNLVKQTDPAVLKNFALLRIFLFQAPDSDYYSRKAFEDYYKTQNYQLYNRSDYCARKILDVVDTASLSYAVTYAYQRYNYDINKIAQAAEMIQNVRNVFQNNVNTSDWMDDQSRDAALKKIQNMLVLLGFPDFANDETELDAFYQNLRICEWDNYGNARMIRAFRQAYQFSQLGKPERTFWGKSTFDPNAYYNRPNNKIVIPISMLNPVFFNGSNPVLDYSRLGSIIGHEITHGFDINGKNYDQDGLPQSWWTEQTMDAFTEKTTCFVDQYSQYYIPELDGFINGSYSINENLADNGGVRESFKAFKQLIQEQDIAANGEYTIEQLFFIGYSTMWCSDESLNYMISTLSTPNGYPTKKYRVIGSLSNMEEFSQAFSCTVGSNMNPENKCALW